MYCVRPGSMLPKWIRGLSTSCKLLENASSHGLRVLEETGHCSKCLKASGGTSGHLGIEPPPGFGLLEGMLHKAKCSLDEHNGCPVPRLLDDLLSLTEVGCGVQGAVQFLWVRAGCLSNCSQLPHTIPVAPTPLPALAEASHLVIPRPRSLEGARPHMMGEL